MNQDTPPVQITVTLDDEAAAKLQAKRDTFKKFKDISSDESATKFDLECEQQNQDQVGQNGDEDGEATSNDENENYISSEDETVCLDARESRRLSTVLRDEARHGCLELKEKKSLYDQKRASWQDIMMFKIPEIRTDVVHDDDLLAEKKKKSAAEKNVSESLKANDDSGNKRRSF